MSVRIMADVWDAGPKDATHCAVMLVLGNFCNDAGTNCFPSIAMIAKMSRRSRRTVERCIAELEGTGWLTVTRGVGRGISSQYAINVARLKGRHDDTLFAADKKVPSTTEKVTPATQKGVTSDIYIEEPSLTIKEPEPSSKDKPSKDKEPTKSSLFRQAFNSYFLHKNGVPAPWDAKEATNLSRWLKKNPTVTVEQWETLLWNRSESPVNHATELSTWIGKAFTWLSKPANEFGGSNDNRNRAGTDKALQASENLAAARRGWRNHHDRAGQDGLFAGHSGTPSLPGGHGEGTSPGKPSRSP